LSQGKVECPQCGHTNSEESHYCENCRWTLYYSKYSVNPHEYEHPEDKAALQTLQKLGPLAALLKFYIEKWITPYTYGEVATKGVRISRRQFPEIYEMVVEAARVLNVNRLPRVYIEPDMTPNAFALGTVHEPFICLTSGAVDIWTKEELLAIIGHEMGHIKSGHIVYHGLGRMLYQIFASGISGAMGIPGAIQLPLLPQINILALPLLRFSRKAELTADRAGLIVGGDVEAAKMADVKMALRSRKLFEEVDIEEFLRQREEFEGFTVENLAATLVELQSTHPISVTRVKAIEEFSKSETYHSMRSKVESMKKGAYPLVPVTKALLESTPPQCPRCAGPISPGEKFCGRCGVDLLTFKHCVRCGRMLEPGLQYCPSCGTRLEGILRPRV